MVGEVLVFQTQLPWILEGRHRSHIGGLSDRVALLKVGESLLTVFLESQHGKHERSEFVAYPIYASDPKPFPVEVVTILYIIP